MEQRSDLAGLVTPAAIQADRIGEVPGRSGDVPGADQVYLADLGGRAWREPVAQGAVGRQGLLVRGDGGRGVACRVPGVADQQQGPGLPCLVAGPDGGGQGALVLDQDLVPVISPRVLSPGQGGRDQVRLHPSLGYHGVRGCGVQVGPLGRHPRGRVLRRSQRRRISGRPARRCGTRGRRARRQLPGGGQRGVGVVVQQPGGGGLGSGRVAGRSPGTGRGRGGDRAARTGPARAR